MKADEVIDLKKKLNAAESNVNLFLEQMTAMKTENDKLKAEIKQMKD